MENVTLAIVGSEQDIGKVMRAIDEEKAASGSIRIMASIRRPFPRSLRSPQRVIAGPALFQHLAHGGKQPAMAGHRARTMGLERAKIKVGLLNLICNMKGLAPLTAAASRQPARSAATPHGMIASAVAQIGRKIPSGGPFSAEGPRPAFFSNFASGIPRVCDVGRLAERKMDFPARAPTQFQ